MNKQRRQGLNGDNLGDVMRSAKNAGKLGTQQFETPLAMATALMVPLTSHRKTIVDLQCGHGALVRAAATKLTQSALGCDIDPTATVPDFGGTRSVIHGDLNGVVPLLREVGWKADLLVLNPPFSLKWPDGDSTLVTWRLANEFLSSRGEGMMICNAGTARRLIEGTPEAKRIWLWVELPCFFPGVDASMTVAVLYFAADHSPDAGESWIEFPLSFREPERVAEALGQFSKNRRRWIRGETVDSDSRECRHTVKLWRAVEAEWKRQRSAAVASRDGWNIRLGKDGRLDVWLTPFQQFSGSIPRELAEELQGMHGEFPASLVVQRSRRGALERAVNGGLWRVEPSVVSAVADAVGAYHRARAPFVKLPATMRLAYLDEEDGIECAVTGHGFVARCRYTMTTMTFEGRKIEKRKRVFMRDEEVLVSGAELAIVVTDDDGRRHCFTQFPPSEAEEPGARPEAEYHRSLLELVEMFTVPDVQDVAELNPAGYGEMKRRLLAMERAA